VEVGEAERGGANEGVANVLMLEEVEDAVLREKVDGLGSGCGSTSSLGYAEAIKIMRKLTKITTTLQSNMVVEAHLLMHEWLGSLMMFRLADTMSIFRGKEECYWT